MNAIQPLPFKIITGEIQLVKVNVKQIVFTKRKIRIAFDETKPSRIIVFNDLA